jgi:hypothetical protein
MRLSPLVFVVLATCTAAPDMMMMTTPDPTAQTAFFRFDTTDRIRSTTPMRPAVGNVYGTLYATSDVTITGPVDDAGSYGDVFVGNVDLRVGLSDAGYVTMPLPAGNYTFLGALDTDDDGGTDRPSHGDLATLPTTNMFTIVDGGTQLKKTIIFDLIYD